MGPGADRSTVILLPRTRENNNVENSFLNSFTELRDAYHEPVPLEECAEPQASVAHLEPIYVTRPHLPPLEDLIPELEGIWERAVLTNNGPLHQRLERKLARYLGVPRCPRAQV